MLGGDVEIFAIDIYEISQYYTKELYGSAKEYFDTGASQSLRWGNVAWGERSRSTDATRCNTLQLSQFLFFCCFRLTSGGEVGKKNKKVCHNGSLRSGNCRYC